MLLSQFEQFLWNITVNRRTIAQRPHEFMNVHWRSFMSLCDPCVVQFKQILRLETMDDDLVPLMNRITSYTMVYKKLKCSDNKLPFL